MIPGKELYDRELTRHRRFGPAHRLQCILRVAACLQEHRQLGVPVLPQELPEPTDAFEYRRSKGSAHNCTGGCWISVT